MRRTIGKRVLVDGHGQGVLRAYAALKQNGPKMCGVELDKPVVSAHA